MEWLLGRPSVYLTVSSAVLVLWSALSLFSRFFLKQSNRHFVLWGLALLTLSLQPFVHMVAELSVPAACIAFWVIQSLGTLLLAAGLPWGRAGRPSSGKLAAVWAALTALWLAGLFLAWSNHGVSAWLASGYLLQAAVIAAATVWNGFDHWARKNVPLMLAFLVFAATSIYFAVSLLSYGSINGHEALTLINALLLCNAMSFVLIAHGSAAAREARNRLNYLVDNTMLGMAFFDSNDCLISANRRLAELLGVDPAVLKPGSTEMASVGLDRVTGGDFSHRTFETSIDYDNLASQGLPVSKTGRAHLLISILSLEDADGLPGTFVQVEDVTESRNLLNELMEKRLRMELMLKAADAYEYVKDGRVLTSGTWFRAMGYPVSTMDIMEFADCIHPQDRHKYTMEQAVGEPRLGSSFNAEARVRDAEGNYVWHYVSSSNLLVEGRVITLGMALNIDRHKRLESYAMQSDRLAAVGQLANGVAHDINNHLMTIQTSLGMLQTVKDEVHRKKYTAYMRDAVENSSGILKRLVSFSKGEEETFAAFDMSVMLAQSKELLERALFRETKLTYANTAKRDHVVGSYFELQNVILNIGLNARDALPEKGGEIAITAWTAGSNPLKPGGSQGWYYISIRDNGCGMSAETQKRIFDPFFTTKPKGRGSGLGLFMAYGNVQRHGGTISVESSEGKGTEFLLALPLAEECALPGVSQGNEGVVS